MVVLGVRDRRHQAGASASAGSVTTCLTGSSDPLSIRPTTSRRSQPEVAFGNVETMISSTCSSWTALSAAVDRVGVADVPGRSMPASLQLRQRAVEPRAPTPGSSAGATRVKSAGRAWRALANRLEQRPADDRLVRDHEDVVALARRGRGRPRRASTGMSLATFRARSTRPARSQLERTAPGWVEMITSSTARTGAARPGAPAAGSGSTIAPRAAMPASCRRSSVRRRRRSALERRLSS